MAKIKACVNCKSIFTESQCPVCGGSETSDSVKGRVFIFNPEKSEIAQNMKVHSKGEFAIKLR